MQSEIQAAHIRKEVPMEAVAALQVTPVLRNLAAASPARATLRDVSRSQAPCSSCNAKTKCLPADLDIEAMRQLEALAKSRIRLRKGETLYRAGGPFAALYAIRFGSLKTVLLAEDGRDQVAGYHMPGEIVGLDGIGNDAHECEAIALEDSEVCALPFERVEQVARDNAVFQHSLHRHLSREIGRQRTLMLLLGTMSAEQRLAAFLLDLSQRYQARGYSSSEFILRMTREEIGSYLGLKLETVSRVFSKFQEEGLIAVHQKNIRILDPKRLREAVGRPPS
jgi:CRP/FNR family transcriptional regulator, anaerobic regulatory protein